MKAVETLKPTEDESPIERPSAQRTYLSYGSESDIETQSSAIASSFQGTESDSVCAAIALQSATSPLDQKLQVIERTIDRLYRLSLAIRQPSVASQNSRASNFVITDDDGVNIEEVFTGFAEKMVDRRCKDAATTLKDRLAKGIVQRRKRFLYRQRHQSKLSVEPKVMVHKPPERTRQDGSDIVTTITITGTPTPLKETHLEANSKKPKRQGLGTLTETEASVLVGKEPPMEKINRDDASRPSTIFTNVPSDSQRVTVPSPPKPLPGSKEFECPYCTHMLPIAQAKPTSWR